ncbi:hypothetical protein CIB48_g1625 [Xylaria polymorpha]|nr:hypothetical protein CIB48_g1625 [Xylaria polymorpha]
MIEGRKPDDPFQEGGADVDEEEEDSEDDDKDDDDEKEEIFTSYLQYTYQDQRLVDNLEVHSPRVGLD